MILNSNKTIYKILKYVKENRFFDVIDAIENRICKKIKIVNPIFIIGLPRTGTTLLSNILNYETHLGTSLYKDIPFIKGMIFWNYINFLYYQNSKKNRIHDDDIMVDMNSPNTFEEVAWIISKVKNQKISYDLNILTNYIKKILKVRNSERYFSKNNNNINRIELINKHFNNSKFLISIRKPENTINSLIRVNKIFNEIFDQDPYFKLLYNELGHKEFNIESNNKNNLNIIYLNEYYKFYSKVLNLIKKKKLKKNILVINHDDLIIKPEKNINRIFYFLNLELDSQRKNLIKKLIKKRKIVNMDNNSNKKLINKCNILYKKITSDNF